MNPRDPKRTRAPLAGVFDSGVGGLTVLHQLWERLPGLGTVYLGDTARVPYGTKSADTVTRYAVEIADFLTGEGADLLVVACNTASAVALDALRDRFDVPVIGVVEPGVQGALAATRSGRIGVIGTEGTVRSEAYVRGLRAERPELEITSVACPLFVPLAEQHWIEDEIAEAVARRYLEPLREAGVDTVILGCTHYPLLKRTIGRVMGTGVTLIDSSEEAAAAVAKAHRAAGLVVPDPTPSTVHRFYTTDLPERFVRIGSEFLGSEIADAKVVSF